MNDYFPLLRWYYKSGIKEVLSLKPINRYTSSFAKPSSPKSENNFYPSAPSVNSLEELRKKVENFERCSLKEFATNTVFSDGNPEAKIMLVGEAPGAEEDKIGKPFVGQSGRLLDEGLKAINLDRSKVYISNIIPWRPPGNRPPTSAEIALCEPFIREHIALINPKILVFLGGVAAKTLLRSNLGISQLRGQWTNYLETSNNIEIPSLSTYHPAYLLRSSSQKSIMWLDLMVLEEAYLKL